MMFFKKLLRKWILQANDVEESMIGSQKISSVEDVAVLNDDPVLNFKVYNAVGGKVVEFRYYDRIKDRGSCQTYIITNEQDFGERIAKIATMESLKR